MSRRIDEISQCLVNMYSFDIVDFLDLVGGANFDIPNILNDSNKKACSIHL